MRLLGTNLTFFLFFIFPVFPEYFQFGKTVPFVKRRQKTEESYQRLKTLRRNSIEKLQEEWSLEFHPYDEG
jgi:hypothetical protein